MKVRKGNRVLQIQEVELPNFVAKGYVLHEEKPVQQPVKQIEKPKKVEEQE